MPVNYNRLFIASPQSTLLAAPVILVKALPEGEVDIQELELML
jgi:hypothetical protein